MQSNSKSENPEIQTLIYEDDTIASNQHCHVLIFTSARDPALGFGRGFF